MLSFGLSAMVLAASTIVGSAGASCAQPDVLPVVAQLPMQVPAMLSAADVHGTARLVVTIAPSDTRPAKVELYETSGYPALDAAAISVARRTVFASANAACPASYGEYLYEFAY